MTRVQVLEVTNAPLWTELPPERSYDPGKRIPTRPVYPEDGTLAECKAMAPFVGQFDREPWECLALAVSEGTVIWYWRRWLVLREPSDRRVEEESHGKSGS